MRVGGSVVLGSWPTRCCIRVSPVVGKCMWAILFQYVPLCQANCSSVGGWNGALVFVSLQYALVFVPFRMA